MTTETLNVEGMTCASCVQSVEKTTKNLTGVTQSNVNLATEKLTINFDANTVSLQEIQDAVSNAGYKAVPDTQKKTFAINGMTCASCAQSVEKATEKLEGVYESNVNLATEKMIVEYDDSIVSVSDIIDAVSNVGYKAREDIDSGKAVDENQQKQDEKRKKIWNRFLISAAFSIPLLYLAMGHMMGAPIPGFLNPMNNPLTFAFAQLLLTIPVAVVNRNIYKNGFRTLFRGHPNMDSLIAVGTGAAIVYGLFALGMIMAGNTGYVHDLYFEAAAMILTLIVLGKYLEELTKGRTSEAIKKLMGLAPKTAIIIRAGNEVEVSIDEVIEGDMIVVKPGEKMPVDGVVAKGSTTVDEAMLTGESMPVEKNVGDQIIGASINKNGTIQYEATKVGKDTALSQIIKLVEDAQGSKAPIAKMADVISGYFVPIVIGIAILSGLVWLISGQSVLFALTIFITVLVIACPCALGLATPTSIMIGTGKGAENGVLIKSGGALETTHKLDTIVFDKTGTITEGKPMVTDIVSTNGISENELLTLSASAEKGSEHPLGEAIVRDAEEKGINFLSTSNFSAIPGHGIEVTINDYNMLLGNKKLMDTRQITLDDLTAKSDALASEGKTPMYIAINDKIAGIIAVADTVKENSLKAIEKLHEMEIGRASWREKA